MNIASLFLFALATMGFTYIVVDSEISKKLKKIIEPKLWPPIVEIIGCYQCMGLYSGLLCGAILVSLNPLIILMCGFAGSFLAVWGIAYLNHLDHRDQ